jgi:hypothetical protein
MSTSNSAIGGRQLAANATEVGGNLVLLLKGTKTGWGVATALKE